MRFGGSMVEESIRYALFDSDRRRPADQPWVGALGTVAPPDEASLGARSVAVISEMAWFRHLSHGHSSAYAKKSHPHFWTAHLRHRVDKTAVQWSLNSGFVRLLLHHLLHHHRRATQKARVPSVHRRDRGAAYGQRRDRKRRRSTAQ